MYVNGIYERKFFQNKNEIASFYPYRIGNITCNKLRYGNIDNACHYIVTIVFNVGDKDMVGFKRAYTAYENNECRMAFDRIMERFGRLMGL